MNSFFSRSSSGIYVLAFDTITSFILLILTVSTGSRLVAAVINSLNVQDELTGEVGIDYPSLVISGLLLLMAILVLCWMVTRFVQHVRIMTAEITITRKHFFKSME